MSRPQGKAAANIDGHLLTFGEVKHRLHRCSECNRISSLSVARACSASSAKGDRSCAGRLLPINVNELGECRRNGCTNPAEHLAYWGEPLCALCVPAVAAALDDLQQWPEGPEHSDHGDQYDADYLRWLAATLAMPKEGT